LSTATICSTLKRFRFTASFFPLQGLIMPETLPQIGFKFGGPTNLAVVWALDTVQADMFSAGVV